MWRRGGWTGGSGGTGRIQEWIFGGRRKDFSEGLLVVRVGHKLSMQCVGGCAEMCEDCAGCGDVRSSAVINSNRSICGLFFFAIKNRVVFILD